jgi:ankyrin repeat protein
VFFVGAGIGEATMSTDEFIELCIKGKPDEVEAAIKNGANVNAKDKYDETALMYAAGNNSNPEAIALLIKNGADANTKDIDGNRAIDFAKENDKLKNTEAFKQLEKASAQ